MNLTVEAVTRVPKEYNGQKYWGIKAGGKWYDFYDQNQPKAGQRYYVEVKTRESQGKTYYRVKPIEEPQKPQETQASTNGNGNGATHAEQEQPKDNRIPLAEWCAAMKAFHTVALELEPDQGLPPEWDDCAVTAIPLLRRSRKRSLKRG